MPGIINTNLSTPSIQALRAERHQVSKGSSFWNQWSNLSTGQKWGRALAWVIPPIGIGFQIKANQWQAKAAAPRPRDTSLEQSDESIKGIPQRSNIVFGNAHRDFIKNGFANDLNKPTQSPIQQGDSRYTPAMVGLPEQFAKDLVRNPKFSLQSHDGSAPVDISKAGDRAQAFRDFFQAAVPNSADKWAVFSSKFLNQFMTNGIGAANVEALKSVGSSPYFVPCDDADFKLKFEAGGESALIEVRSQGKPNDLPDIDIEKSKVDNFLLIRIKLGPQEDLQVLSGYSKHHLVPKQPSENSEVENAVPVQQPNTSEPISKDMGASLLTNFARGAFGAGSERFKNLNDYKGQLLKQDLLDLTAFQDAFTRLDDQESRQKLIGELAGVIKDKEHGQYMDIASESDDPDMIIKAEILSDIRLNEAYPLSTRNAINPEKGPVVKNARDLDIQNFVHRKVEEEVAQKHLGVPADQFFTIIKEGMGPEAILTTGYLNKKDLPPALETLRTELLQAFDEATTLDDFYSKASTHIENARQLADN